MTGEVWRREVGRPVIMMVPSAPDRLQAMLTFIRWRAGSLLEVGLSMELGEFQRAWDAGWLGFGQDSLPPNAEWFFDSRAPIEVTACLQRPLPWPDDLAPPSRLERIESALTDPSSASDIVPIVRDISSWRYLSVVQERSAGVKMGFYARMRERP